MMICNESLSKEFCILCRNNRFSNLEFRWNKEDDNDWNRGFVYCPMEYFGNRIETPPEKCPYQLEHLIATQGEPAQ